MGVSGRVAWVRWAVRPDSRWETQPAKSSPTTLATSATAMATNTATFMPTRRPPRTSGGTPFSSATRKVAAPAARRLPCGTMSRLPYLNRDQLDDAGRAVWDGLTESRGQRIVNDEGGLVGPFNAWLYAPGVGGHAGALGATIRFESSLDPRLLELAIIVVAAHWKAEYEWWAHARLAREHGVADATVDAIGRGEKPALEAADEVAVYTFARELVVSGRVQDATYAAAVEHLGYRGVVELMSTCGYYTLVSFNLNTFEVPLPPGVAANWPEPERTR